MAAETQKTGPSPIPEVNMEVATEQLDSDSDLPTMELPQANRLLDFETSSIESSPAHNNDKVSETGSEDFGSLFNDNQSSIGSDKPALDEDIDELLDKLFNKHDTDDLSDQLPVDDSAAPNLGLADMPQQSSQASLGSIYPFKKIEVSLLQEQQF